MDSVHAVKAIIICADRGPVVNKTPPKLNLTKLHTQCREVQGRNSKLKLNLSKLNSTHNAGRFKAEINLDAAVIASRTMARFHGLQQLRLEQTEAEVRMSGMRRT